MSALNVAEQLFAMGQLREARQWRDLGKAHWQLAYGDLTQLLERFGMMQCMLMP